MSVGLADMSVAAAKSRGSPLAEYYAALRRLLPVGQPCIEAIAYMWEFRAEEGGPRMS